MLYNRVLELTTGDLCMQTGNDKPKPPFGAMVLVNSTLVGFGFATLVMAGSFTGQGSVNPAYTTVGFLVGFMLTVVVIYVVEIYVRVVSQKT